MRVFIACPANLASGGPELLHQLSACLTELGVENYMVYWKRNGADNPVPEPYEKYNTKYVSMFVDAPDSVLVLPETGLDAVPCVEKGQVFIWWLSVDNFLSVCSLQEKHPYQFVQETLRKDNVMHFVQSWYAKDYLEHEMGIETTYYLSDYINSDILHYALEHRVDSQRENICLYNPQKGFEHVKRLLDASEDAIKWIPLKDMGPLEMAELMCRAKVYVDFGNHPGKDRIPREAAACGCIVITNRKGSAAYTQDMPIPEGFRLEDISDTAAVLRLIREAFERYEQLTPLYADYRAMIEGEKQKFYRDAGAVFRLIGERNGEGYTAEPEQKRSICQMADMLKRASQKSLELFTQTAEKIADEEYAGAVSELLGADSLLNTMQECIYALSAKIGNLDFTDEGTQNDQ